MVAVALAALAVAGVGAGLYARWDRVENEVRSRLVRALAGVLRGRVEVGELDIHLGRLEVIARDVRVSVPGPTPEVPPAEAGAEIVRIRLGWEGLLGIAGRRLRAREVDLLAPWGRFDKRYFDALPRNRKRERRPVELHFGLLRVRGGRLRFADVELPITVNARDVAIEGGWSSFRRAITGKLELTADVALDQFRQPLPVRLRSGFRLTGTRVEMYAAELSAPGIEVDLRHQTISWDGRSMVSATAEVHAQLDTIGGLLRGFPEIGGRAHGDLSWSHAEGVFQVRGRLAGEDVVFGPLRLASARVDATVDPGIASLDIREAAGLGGTLAGQVKLRTRGEPRMEVEARGTALRLSALQELIDLRLPFEGSADLTMRFVGDPLERRTWKVHGEADVRPPTWGSAALPLSARATFGIENGVVRVSSDAARIGGATELAASIRLDLLRGGGRVDLDGTTADARATQEGALFLMDAIDIAVPDDLREPIFGHGTLRTSIPLATAETLTFAAELTDGAVGPDAFDRLEVAVELREDTLVLPRLYLENAEGGRVTVALESDLSTAEILIVEADLEHIPIDTLTRRLEVDNPGVEGAVSARIELARGQHGLWGEGDVVVRDGRYLGQEFDEFAGAIRVDRDVVTVDDAVVRGHAFEARGSAVYDLADGTMAVEIDDATIDAARLEGIEGAVEGLSATLGARGHISLSDDVLGGRIDLDLPQWSVNERSLPALRGAVEFGESAMRIFAESADSDRLRLRGALAYDDVATFDGTLDLDALRIPLVDDPTLPPAWAKLTGKWSVRGPLLSPEGLLVEGGLQAAELRFGGRVLRMAEEAPVTFAGNVGQVGPARFVGPGTAVEGELRVDVGGGTVKGSLTGQLDLGVLSAALSEVSATGPVELAVEIAGTLDRPEITGRAGLEGGRLAFAGIRQPLEAVSASVSFGGDELTVHDLRGRLGGGTVQGSGVAGLAGAGVDSYRLELRLDRVRIAYPDGFRAVYDGRLRIRGDARTALLDGSIDVPLGVYTKPFDLLASLAGGSREYGTAEDLELPVQVFLDVELNSGGNVWVRNNVARLESDFDLNVGGDLGHPEVTGRLRLREGGWLDFRDVRYRIDFGTLEFVDLERINPYMNLRASTEVEGYDIQLKIEGTLDRFDYQLSSSPALSQQDILALLTTGSTLEDLSSSSASGGAGEFLTGDVAASYFSQALTGRFERGLEDVFGLSRFQILPSDITGADPTARVTIGKEVAEGLDVLYSSDVGSTENQLYRAEWRASSRWRLSAERDTTGGVGGDVRFLDRFWISKARRADASQSARPAENESAQTVGRVGVAGVPEGDAVKLLARLPVRTGERLRRGAVFDAADEIRGRLVSEGRIASRVEPAVEPRAADPTIVDIRFDVAVSDPVDVVIEGVGVWTRLRLSKRLREQWRGMVIADDVIEDSVETIRGYFVARGHYTVDVSRRVDSREGRERVTFLVDPGPSVSVRSVSLVGAHQLSEERVRRQLLTKSGGPLRKRVLVPETLADDVVAVRNLYRDEGYLDAVVDPPAIRLSADGTTSDVTIAIREGPRYVLRTVEFAGGESVPGFEPSRVAGLAAGAPFSPAKIASARVGLGLELDRLGYPAARVDASSERSAEGVDVHFQMDPGAQRRIGAIEVDGNVLTKEKIIRGELDLEVGDVVSREELLRNQLQLYRLGTLRNAGIERSPMSPDDPNLERLTVRVEEAPPWSTSASLGYDTEASIRGLLSLTHSNLGGYGRSVSLLGKLSGIEQVVRLTLDEPRLFTRRWPALISAGYEYTEEPEFTEINRTVALRVGIPISRKWKSFVRYAYQNVDLSDLSEDAEEELVDQKLEDVALGDIGQTIIRDLRDDPFNPTRGSYFATDNRWFAKAWLSEETFVKSFSGFGWLKTFRTGQAYALGTRLGIAVPYGATEEVPLSERFFAGGDSTLRGFSRDDVVPLGGEGLLLLNQEWRVPVWGSVRGVLFSDIGNVYEKLADFDPTDLRYVLGLGLRFETAIGPVRIEYGHKLDREEGESAGEFFLAIGNPF